MIQYKTLVRQIRLAVTATIICLTCSCDPPPPPDPGASDEFDTVPQKFDIEPGVIDEASGLAPSLRMSGHLWTHQDSGQPNSLYLVDPKGKIVKEYPIPGTQNRDWEDMAAGPGPEAGAHYLYIGDIGNNNQPAAEYLTIYRVPEINDPSAAFDGQKVEKITFRYPDGIKDAECLLLDPVTKDIFVVSKELQTATIYRLPFPQSTTEPMTAEKVGTVPNVSIATGGSVSPNGNEIVLRTYLSVSYWRRNGSESIGQTLSRPATRQLFVAPEPQGEAICFEFDANGFYTLSERANANSVTLNFYKRK